jgi:hypothetical protein
MDEHEPAFEPAFEPAIEPAQMPDFEPSQMLTFEPTFETELADPDPEPVTGVVSASEPEPETPPESKTPPPTEDDENTPQTYRPEVSGERGCPAPEAVAFATAAFVGAGILYCLQYLE